MIVMELSFRLKALTEKIFAVWAVGITYEAVRLRSRDRRWVSFVNTLS